MTDYASIKINRDWLSTLQEATLVSADKISTDDIVRIRKFGKASSNQENELSTSEQRGREDAVFEAKN